MTLPPGRRSRHDWPCALCTRIKSLNMSSPYGLWHRKVLGFMSHFMSSRVLVRIPSTSRCIQYTQCIALTRSTWFCWSIYPSTLLHRLSEIYGKQLLSSLCCFVTLISTVRLKGASVSQITTQCFTLLASGLFQSSGILSTPEHNAWMSL